MVELLAWCLMVVGENYPCVLKLGIQNLAWETFSNWGVERKGDRKFIGKLAVRNKAKVTINH